MCQTEMHGKEEDHHFKHRGVAKWENSCHYAEGKQVNKRLYGL